MCGKKDFPMPHISIHFIAIQHQDKFGAMCQDRRMDGRTVEADGSSSRNTNGELVIQLSLLAMTEYILQAGKENIHNTESST